MIIWYILIESIFAKGNGQMKKLLALLLAVTVTMQIIPTRDLHAASKDTRYVKEFKLFVKTNGSKSDAEAWCKKKNEDNEKKGEVTDWKVIPGNLNEGAEGALKKAEGVFLCYQTTDDPTKAVTDIAVMNENGNYAEGVYEQILEEQQKVFSDLVDDMQEMLTEYRANYAQQVDTAVQAHDFMNGYKEDDSGKGLGDLLLNINKEDLTKIFLQANGQIILMIQDQLAYAADTGKSTWLDRMSQLGSYDTLRKKALKACGNDGKKADIALKNKYHAKAVELLDSWGDVNAVIKSTSKLSKKLGVDKMSSKEFNKYVKESYEDEDVDPDLIVLLNQQEIITLLGAYEYDGATLLQFFAKDYDEVSGDNIKYLYPLVASLTTSQMAAVKQSVNLVKLVQDAASATVYNDNLTMGKAAELDKLDSKDKKAIQESEEEFDGMVKDFSQNQISIYEGVDREIFKGGVAVTSTAENYSKGHEANWTDSFVDSGKFKTITISIGAAAVAFGAGALISSRMIKVVSDNIVKSAYNANRTMYQMARITHHDSLSQTTFFTIKDYSYEEFTQMANGTTGQVARYNHVSKELYEKGVAEGTGKTALAVTRGLKIGLAVFAILLAVADITLTIITLVEYYNRDHLPIPKFMVDVLSYEDTETAYVRYRSVPDQNGNNGDLNGGGGKQWLALYQTREESGGKPIIAPSATGKEIQVLTGSSNKNTPANYYPLHMFGTYNASQNLTFADGEKGFSYNDKKNGIYLYFQRDLEANTSLIGTVMGRDSVALIGGGALLGFMIAVIGVLVFKKRKEA